MRTGGWELAWERPRMGTPWQAASTRRGVASPSCRTRARRYVEPYGIALGYAGLGDRDGAIEWLEHAYREHSFWLTAWAKVDPRLDILRDDSRFQASPEAAGGLRVKVASGLRPFARRLLQANLFDRTNVR